MDQLIFASLSHTHYWYEVGMLKVPAVILYNPYRQYNVRCLQKGNSLADFRGHRIPDGDSSHFRRIFIDNGLSHETGNFVGIKEILMNMYVVSGLAFQVRQCSMFSRRSMDCFRGGPASFSAILQKPKSYYVFTTHYH